MKDLEIRGAGNILGAEQSGHIAGVGFDLYIRLVGEAVAAFRKQAGAGLDASIEDEQLLEVRVDLPVDAHVPHDYVDGERLRLEVYRKIAEAADEDDAGRDRRRADRPLRRAADAGATTCWPWPVPAAVPAAGGHRGGRRRLR